MASKGKIAALSAVGLAVVLLAAGYGVSVAKFNSALDKAEQDIANFINQELKLSEREAVSLEFHETKDSGVFNRKLNLVIADPQSNVQVPLDASIGFLSYEFVADLPQATYNGVKLFETYRDDLENLTKLDMRAKSHLLTGKSEVLFAAAGLNEPQNALLMVENSEDRQAINEDAAAFTKSKGFKEQGTLDARLTFDRDMNIALHGTLSDVITPELAVKELTFSTASQGIGKMVTDLGYVEMSFNDLYAASLFTTHHVQQATLRSEATPFDANGNFDMKVDVQATAINEDLKDVNLSLGINQLNYQGLLELSERMMFTSNAGVEYLSQYPFNVELYPNTKVIYHDTGIEQDVEVTAQGQLNNKAGEKIEGNVNVNVSADVTKLKDLSGLDRFFVVEGEQSKSEIKFDLPFGGNSQVLINGKPM